jgi:hypothetical protein
MPRITPLLSLAVVACQPATGDDFDTAAPEGDGASNLAGPGVSLASPSEDRFKAWGASDDPDLLDATFNYTLADLPTEGEAEKVPWTGNYWPTYRDSLNYKWDGASSDSPAAKFGQAFGKADIEDNISRGYGIDSRAAAGAATCAEDSACDSDKGETCAKRDGEDEGYCVETWFGICHAWAPATIMEHEPLQAVTHNGVDFAINDIKALVSLSYDEGLSVKFMSLRCDDKDNPDAPECADTNPGSFHVAIANLVGLQRKSLVEDRTYDYEVWNQPIRAFEVTQNSTVTAAGAMSLLGESGDAYTFNADAVSFAHVKMSLDYISESPQSLDGNLAATIDVYTHTDHYDYILELDAAGAIIGGEWVGDSKTNHPDFLWMGTIKTQTEVALDAAGAHGSGVAWSEVQILLEKSLDVGDDSGDDSGDGFDWGSACEDGEGSFEQAIEKSAAVVVGDVPVDRANVRIDLTSGADVDVQMIDAETGYEIIAWPSGALNGAGEACAEHHDVTYCYSGYNGDGTNYGHEWIEIRGVTNRAVTMKAYGYAAGDAAVAYSWEAAPDCVDRGYGSFQQDIAERARVVVGDIPEGKSNVRIDLMSNEDVDIELYAGVDAIIQWPDGLLNGAGRQTVDYDGLSISWSGYNGDGKNAGYEYITIEGDVRGDLTMKAYGYAAGEARVEYAWGLDGAAF